MALTKFTHVRVDEPSQVGEARRAAVAFTSALGYGERDASGVALAVTELATNLVKHAKAGGDIVLALHPDMERLDVLALDGGPGIPNVGVAMRDGFSTAGTVGSGLGAIERAATAIELRSGVHGTVILARFGPRPAHEVEVGGACLATGGETISGDAWDYARSRGKVRLIVADGLGHGPRAAEAARAAVECFAEHVSTPLDDAMGRIHAALRSTRGAAVALVEIDEAADVIHFLSVGNVSGQILGDRDRALVCTPGTVGHAMRTMRVTDYPFHAGDALLLHTDGVKGSIHLTDYPGLGTKDPALVAGVLVSERARGTDDATVVVARRARSEA